MTTLPRTRRNTTVPRPWATTDADVIANFYAGVRQLRLDQMPSLDRLTMRNSGWTVGAVLRVTSLLDESTYYLLHILDGAGRIVGSGLVNAEGYLLGYEDSQHVSPPRPLGLGSAGSALDNRVPGVLRRAARYIHAPGTLEPGASRFAPLVQLDRADGEFYVTSAGRVFRDTKRTRPVDAGAYSRPVLMRQNGLSELNEIR
jgi:hypothetical protein